MGALGGQQRGRRWSRVDTMSLRLPAGAHLGGPRPGLAVSSCPLLGHTAEEGPLPVFSQEAVPTALSSHSAGRDPGTTRRPRVPFAFLGFSLSRVLVDDAPVPVPRGLVALPWARGWQGQLRLRSDLPPCVSRTQGTSYQLGVVSGHRPLTAQEVHLSAPSSRPRDLGRVGGIPPGMDWIPAGILNSCPEQRPSSSDRRPSAVAPRTGQPPMSGLS